MKFPCFILLANLVWCVVSGKDDSSYLLRGQQLETVPQQGPSGRPPLLVVEEPGHRHPLLAKLELRDCISAEFEQAGDDIYIIMTAPEESMEALQSPLDPEDDEDGDTTNLPVKLFRKLNPDAQVPQALVEATKMSDPQKTTLTSFLVAMSVSLKTSV